MRSGRVIVGLALALGPTSAWAGEGPTATTTSTTGLLRPVGPVGYATTLGLLLAAGATTVLLPHPPGGWKASTFFDDWLFDVFRFENPNTQDDVSAFSDVLANLLTVLPVLDVGLSAGLYAQDPGRMLQLWSVDLEAGALAATLLVISKRVVSRVRPGIPVCEGTLDDYRCRSDASRRSFASGHATASFTGAGLTCLHHSQDQLWGGGWPDGLACGTALGLALTTSLLRVASDQHYATDVMGGAAIGLLSGFLVPYLLHYAPEEAQPGWPSGHLQLLLGGGTLTAGGAPRAVGAAELGLELRQPLRALRLTLGVDGRLLRRDQGTEMQAVLPRVLLGLGPLDLGLGADYRRQSLGELRFDTLSAGPWLRLDGELLVAELAWLPGGDGDVRTGLARLEWWPWSFLLLRAETSISKVAVPEERHVGTFLLSLGGRLNF